MEHHYRSLSIPVRGMMLSWFSRWCRRARFQVMNHRACQRKKIGADLKMAASRLKVYLKTVTGTIGTKDLSVNKSFVPASGFWIASAAPQSQNPRRRPATPAVLLNPRDQNRSQNPALPERPIYGQALRNVTHFQ